MAASRKNRTYGCIVCLKPFTPRRADQVYCSNRDPITRSHIGSCWDHMLIIERHMKPRLEQMVEIQLNRCSVCSVSFNTTLPSLLLSDPSKFVIIAGDVESITDEADLIVNAACRVCRSAYYGNRARTMFGTLAVT